MNDQISHMVKRLNTNFHHNMLALKNSTGVCLRASKVFDTDLQFVSVVLES